MKWSRFWKKTVSMTLACAMLTSLFAQCVFAEESPDAEIVIDALETAPAEESADVPAGQDAAAQEDAEAQSVAADEIPGDVQPDGGELTVTVDAIETIGADPGIATISAADPNVTQRNFGIFTYEVNEGGDTVMITGLNDEVTETLTLPDEVIEDEEELGEVSKKVTEIADGAFLGKSVNGMLPSSLTTIGTSAFKNCTFTGTFTLPSTLTTIEEGAFEGCEFPGGLTLPASVASIGKNAFKDCKFNGSLTLPAGLTTIEEGVFSGCSGLNDALKIPASVTEIGASAFENCSGFTSLSFQGSAAESIGASAFAGCAGLSGTLTLPASVTSVGASAFKGCSGLTAVNFGGLTSISDSVFEDCTGLSGTLTIPAGITSIGASAFKGCSGYAYLIPGEAVTSIGESAFEGCTGLKNGDLVQPELTFPASLKTIGARAFYGCSGLSGSLDLSELEAPNIGLNAFFECEGFTELSFPDDTTGINAQAFFSSICIDEGETPLEVQVGDQLVLPDVYAGNGKLQLLNQVMWTWEPDDVTAELTGSSPSWRAAEAGTVTLTATAYNNATATKKVIIKAADSTTDNIPPTVKSVSGGGAVLKPNSFKLTMSLVEANSGIVALSGYFCKVGDSAKQIPFTYDCKDRIFTGTITDVTVNVPSTAAVGSYYLGGMTLQDGSGNATTYTYNYGTGKWKNGSGSIVTINTSDSGVEVFDRFDRDSFATSIYITGASKCFETDTYKNDGLIITYDTTNSKILKDWLQKAKANATRLLLSDGKVEWSVLNTDISAANADFNCLVTLAAMNASRYGNSAAVMTVNFAGISALPGKAVVRIRADQMGGLYDQTKAVYVYSMNANETLTKQEIAVSYVQSNGQYWYEFQVTNATPAKLIMSGHALNLEPSRKVETIQLNKTNLELVKGKTYTLKATAGPSYAEDKSVKWTSSNTRIATVNAKGKVTTKRYGKVTITATAKDGSGVVAKCKLVVGYKIKYKLNGGKNNKENPKVYYKTKVTLKDPTRSGYKFKGWYTDKNFKHRIKTIPKSYKRKMTLYAKWKKK